MIHSSAGEAGLRARLHVLCVALAGALASLPGTTHGAPQTFDTALPVAKGEFVIRGQLVAVRASDDPSPADRKLEVVGGGVVAGYGATSKLALFGALPTLRKTLDVAAGGQRITRRTTGIGDARVFARYTAFQRDGRGRSLRIAPILGLELPTGDDHDRDGLGRLPASLQLGSGSWDPFAGVVATYQTLAYQVDAQIGYQANTKGDDVELGDELRLDVSLQYRLWPRALVSGVPGFLYGVVEANLRHRDEDEIRGDEDPDSGGTTLFLSPGLQYVTRRWVLEAVVQLPIVQDLGGSALEDDYTVRAGFRVNF